MPATPHGSVTSAVLRTPAFDPWLTTADIGTFAAERLAQTRAWAADQRAKAIAHAGQQEALDCALRIDVFKGWCDNVAVLGLLAIRQGDHATATAIEADVASTTRLLIEQSHTARMLSVPGWNLATRSFAAPEPAPQVVQ